MYYIFVKEGDSMTVYERIRQLREQLGMTQEQLAFKVGYKSRSTINKIENGLRDINQSQIVDFAQALSTTPAYLMGWEEEKDKKPIPKQRPAKTRRVLVHGTASGGYPTYMDSDYIDIDDIAEFEYVEEKYFNGFDPIVAIKVHGQSMEPEVHDGDVIIVRMQCTVDNGDIAVVAIDNETATLKIIKNTKKGLELHPINEEYETLFYTWEQVRELPVRIVGKLLEARRKF
ncbi:helix-turn-helix domain-containing protein [Criibacterium bergeronii]|uniref:Helix-turn-helix domain-containing protein n=2 Tax=Criibacterium bergeronii TaxID=1871336 RepID=A0A371IJV5_9FIRM|nr:helix-turn-helix domain-containing protein [Criibacterium bergeronii]